MWSLMTDVCRAMGVRTDIPFKDLTDEEKEIVYDGPAVKKHIFYRPKNGSNEAGELDFTYYSAVHTVENALAKVKDDKGMKRVSRFLKEETCPDCQGSRFSETARKPHLRGISIDEACRMTLGEITEWVKGVPESLSEEMRPMAESICGSFLRTAKEADGSWPVLSFAGQGRKHALYRRKAENAAGKSGPEQDDRRPLCLDEPSIGLHPSNIEGLCGVMKDLVSDGNSVVLVDHDTQILERSILDC